MKEMCFNIVYEYDNEDVDIIGVPAAIAENIEVLAQEFLDWLPSAGDDLYWTMVSGHKSSVCETEGFVKWLNDYHCVDTQKVSIKKKHTHYCDKYGAIDF